MYLSCLNFLPDGLFHDLITPTLIWLAWLLNLLDRNYCRVCPSPARTNVLICRNETNPKEMFRVRRRPDVCCHGVSTLCLLAELLEPYSYTFLCSHKNVKRQISILKTKSRILLISTQVDKTAYWMWAVLQLCKIKTPLSYFFYFFFSIWPITFHPLIPVLIVGLHSFLQEKSCGNAGDLPNGQFEYEGNSYIGERVYATCNDG